MARRPLNQDEIRKIMRIGKTSYTVTIPIQAIRELGWREKQKVVVKKVGKKIVIQDWKRT